MIQEGGFCQCEFTLIPARLKFNAIGWFCRFIFLCLCQPRNLASVAESEWSRSVQKCFKENIDGAKYPGQTQRKGTNTMYECMN